MHPLMTWSGLDPARRRTTRADSAYPSEAGLAEGARRVVTSGENHSQQMSASGTFRTAHLH